MWPLFLGFRPFNHTCAWKFFSEGEWSKNLLGGCGGILFFSKFLKLQVLVARGCGQRCLINFQMGDLDRVSIKFFSEGGVVKKFVGGDVGGDPNVQSTIREGNFFLFFSKFLKIRSGNYKF